MKLFGGERRFITIVGNGRRRRGDEKGSWRSVPGFTIGESRPRKKAPSSKEGIVFFNLQKKKGGVLSPEMGRKLYKTGGTTRKPSLREEVEDLAEAI